MCSTSVSCPLCYKSSFPNIDTLRNSLIKAANGPVSCPICNEILLGLDKLTIHLFSHTNLMLTITKEPILPPPSDTMFQSFCTKGETSTSPQKDTNSISTLSLVENSNSVPKIPATVQESCVAQIKCDICELAFRSVDLLRMHNKLIHRAPDEALNGVAVTDIRYQCHLCAKMFKMKGSLRVHLKVVHLIGLQANKDCPKLNICQKIKTKNIQALIPSAVGVHLTASGEEPNPSNIATTSNILPDNCQPVTIDTNKPSINVIPVKAAEAPKIWECDICAKSFTTKYFLKKHKRLHTGEMPYTCNICGKTFTFQQSYHKHLLYHSDEKPHSCQTCGRAFKELSTLHNHERIHSGEKPFECETCGKCFRQRVSYLVHKRIHTGAMPYKCTACDKSFRYKVSQRTHKCTAQPPGMVVRQGGDLLEKLLQTTSAMAKPDGKDTEGIHVGRDIEHINQTDLVRTENHEEELLIRSIDEIVSESCNKLGIENVHDIGESIKLGVNENIAELDKVQTPSPTAKLENLCLYSPSDNSLISPFDTICEEALKTLLNETA